ncbi:hypothetical protein D3C80_2007540 [compost metagenome]
MEVYEQNHKYYSVLLGDHGDAAFAGKLKNAIKPMIKEALKCHVKVSETELDFILEYILSAMIGVMSYWFKQDKALPSKKLIALITEIMENGVICAIK